MTSLIKFTITIVSFFVVTYVISIAAYAPHGVTGGLFTDITTIAFGTGLVGYPALIGLFSAYLVNNICTKRGL
ncbi:hypothetical protein AB6D77_08055 [Vibrio splendidus]